NFHAPAPDKPTQHLLWRMHDLSREKGLRLERAEHVTHQYPANFDVRFACRAPQANFTVDFNLTLATAIPVCNLQLLPLCLRGLQTLWWRRATRTFAAWVAHLTKLAWRHEIIKLRVQPRARNQAHLLQPTDTVEQVKHRKATVSCENQHSLGPPTREQ